MIDNQAPPAFSRGDVERLKSQWLEDPSWPLEDTAGFEAWHDELAEFRRGVSLTGPTVHSKT